MSDQAREGSGGLILCGGLSSRMGFEKARLPFPGGSLLQRVLGRMRQVASPVVLALSQGQSPGGLPEDVITVRDSAPEQGPLQGMLEGFRALDGRCGRVILMPVDMPYFTPQWMTRLLNGLDGPEGHRACLYEFKGFANALTAAYDMALLPKLEALVAEGARRPMFLSRDEPTHVISIADDPDGDDGEAARHAHPLTDVDTPEAYRAALLAEGVGTPGGAAVTVSLRPGALPDAPPQDGYAALFAATAGDVLAALGQLYPGLAGEIPDAAGRLRLERGEPGAGEPLLPGAPLRDGEHLTLWCPV